MPSTVTLTIEGHSDDTVGCYGLPCTHYLHEWPRGRAGDDFDTCANNEPLFGFLIWSQREQRGLRVLAVHAGWWAFAIGPALLPGTYQDGSFPDWPMDREFDAKRGTERVLLDAPDDAVVIWGPRHNAQWKDPKRFEHLTRPPDDDAY